MKLLVIGASGQVGHYVAWLARQRGHQVVGTSRSCQQPGLTHLDISTAADCAALVSAEKPDAIVIAAAYTHVDGCEKDPARARLVNVSGVANVLDAARPLGCTVVHYSTDYVFDGKEGPYSEDAVPEPICVYGATKFDGENFVKGYPGRWLVLRTTGVFSYEPGAKNFAMQVINRVRRGESVRAPLDQISTPTYAPDLASATLDLLAGDHRGVYHVAGDALLGRVAFARLVLGTFDLDINKLVAVKTSEMGQTSPRPLHGGLLVDKLRGAIGSVPRPAAEALLDMRERWADYEKCWQQS